MPFGSLLSQDDTFKPRNQADCDQSPMPFGSLLSQDPGLGALAAPAATASPMPFGSLLSQDTIQFFRGNGISRMVTNAFRLFALSGRSPTKAGSMGKSPSHQCLSALCSLRTSPRCSGRAGGGCWSPMPFGSLLSQDGRRSTRLVSFASGVTNAFRLFALSGLHALMGKPFLTV